PSFESVSYHMDLDKWRQMVAQKVQITLRAEGKDPPPSSLTGCPIANLVLDMTRERALKLRKNEAFVPPTGNHPFSHHALIPQGVKLGPHRYYTQGDFY